MTVKQEKKPKGEIWANTKGPRILGFGKIFLLQIQGIRFGNLEGFGKIASLNGLRFGKRT